MNILEIVVEDKNELNKINSWITTLRLPSKSYDVSVYCREDQTTYFYNVDNLGFIKEGKVLDNEH